MIHSYVWFMLAVFTAVNAIHYPVVKSCEADSLSTLGFTARFYSYQLRSEVGWGSKFFRGLYRTSLIKQIEGIRTVNFSDTDPESEIMKKMRLRYITVSNFTLELSGFFTVPESGVYHFQIAADDGASFNVGAGDHCCKDASRSVKNDPEMEAIGAKEKKPGIRKISNSASYDLTKGMYYPIRIVMFNWEGAGGLSLGVQFANKTKIPEFDKWVRRLNFEDRVCYATVTPAWEEPYIKTTTQISQPYLDTLTVYVRVPKKTRKVTKFGENGVTLTKVQPGELTDIEMIEIPKPESFTTEAWPEDHRSLSIDTSPKQYNLVHVFVPKQFVTTTLTWEHPHIMEITQKGEFTDYITINVPTPTRSVTVAWYNDFTSTTTIHGEIGGTDIVSVNIPKVIVEETKTWTGDSILKETEVGDWTDHITINVPTPTRSVTVAWYNDFTSTTTIHGEIGGTDIVSVNIPKVIVEETKTWTGDSILKRTEAGRWTDYVDVFVPTPTQSVTVAWENDFTSSITMYGDPGESNKVIVKIKNVGVNPLKSANQANKLAIIAEERPAEVNDEGPSWSKLTGLDAITKTDDAINVKEKARDSEKHLPKMGLNRFYNQTDSHSFPKEDPDNNPGAKVFHPPSFSKELEYAIKQMSEGKFSSHFEKSISLKMPFSNQAYYGQLSGSPAVSTQEATTTEVFEVVQLDENVLKPQSCKVSHPTGQIEMLKEGTSGGSYSCSEPEMSTSLSNVVGFRYSEIDGGRIALDTSAQKPHQETRQTSLPLSTSLQYSSDSRLSDKRESEIGAYISTRNVEVGATESSAVPSIVEPWPCQDSECFKSTRSRTCHMCDFEYTITEQSFVKYKPPSGQSSSESRPHNDRGGAVDTATSNSSRIHFEPTKSAMITAMEGGVPSLSIVLLMLIIPGVVLIW